MNPTLLQSLPRWPNISRRSIVGRSVVRQGKAGLAGRSAQRRAIRVSQPRRAIQASDASDVYDAIEAVKDANGGQFPKNVTEQTAREMAKSMRRYFEGCAEDKIKAFTDEALRIAQDAMKAKQVERPGVKGTVTEAIRPDPDRILLRDFIESHTLKNLADTMNVRFFLKIPSEISRGAGTFIRDNANEDAVDLYPAWELARSYQRDVPRGEEIVKGVQQTWNAWDDEDGRWVHACIESGDEDAMRVFDDSGRMVALKSSPVWQALGDGAGGYEDTLGSPFGPFAFNSGFRQTPIDRPEAEELGLLGPGEEAEPASYDFANLFKLESRNALMAEFNPDEPRDQSGKWTAAGAFAHKHGLVALERVGQDEKGKGGKWQLKGGGDAPEHAKGIVPPGYHDVHVNPDPKADVQGVGTDDKGRTKRFYSKAFDDRNAAEKFGRIDDLRADKGRVFAQNDAAMLHPDEKVRENAACMKLIQQAGIRPGSDTDTKAKAQAYGATTLEGRHVHIDQDGRVRLRFVGKEGKNLDIPVDDKSTGEMLIHRKAAAGDSGRLFKTDDAALRDYSHKYLDDGGFNPKDFRTLKGTEEAAKLVEQTPDKPSTMKEYKKRVIEVAKRVAEKLGNTPAIALKRYIHPSVFQKWSLA